MIDKFEYIKQYKIDKGCQICGYNKNAAALSFAHIDPKTKYRTKSGKILHPADMFKQSAEYSMKVINEEIAKCRVLCSNCHMELTYPQMDKIA
jgi:hypothetical protein